MKFSNLSNVFGSNYVVEDNEGAMDSVKNIIDSSEAKRFYHFNVDDLMNRVDTWRGLLPRVTPHYAVKCNSDPSVLRTLEFMGVNFDCASRGEIKMVLGMGVDPSRIIFAHPCKVAGDIKYAKKNGVRRTTFDSAVELHKIARLDPSASLLLRIRCDALEAQCMLGMKFGVLPEEARSLLILARELELNIVGVAFHVGSGCAEPEVFLRAIRSAHQVFKEAEEEGHEPCILDIGGGFMASNFEETAGFVNQALDDHFPEDCGVEIIAEPGRYLVSSAFTLATPVLGRRDLLLKNGNCPEDNGNKAMIFIDDGLYGSFNCILYENKVVKPLLLEGAHEGAENMPMSVWGPTCDSMDQVLESVALPCGLTVGDWLVWQDMGAYTLSGACNFNGFEAPRVIPHMSSNAELRLKDFAIEGSTRSDCISEISSGFGSSEEEANDGSIGCLDMKQIDNLTARLEAAKMAPCSLIKA